MMGTVSKAERIRDILTFVKEYAQKINEKIKNDTQIKLKKTKNNCLFDISVGIHLIVPNGMMEAVENIVTIESNNTNSNNIFLWKSNSAELRMFFDEFKLSEST